MNFAYNVFVFKFSNFFEFAIYLGVRNKENTFPANSAFRLYFQNFVFAAKKIK